jgi:hypothetical protein
MVCVCIYISTCTYYVITQWHLNTHTHTHTLWQIWCTQNIIRKDTIFWGILITCGPKSCTIHKQTPWHTRAGLFCNSSILINHPWPWPWPWDKTRIIIAGAWQEQAQRMPLRIVAVSATGKLLLHPLQQMFFFSHAPAILIQIKIQNHIEAPSTSFGQSTKESTPIPRWHLKNNHWGPKNGLQRSPKVWYQLITRIPLKRRKLTRQLVCNRQ